MLSKSQIERLAKVDPKIFTREFAKLQYGVEGAHNTMKRILDNIDDEEIIRHLIRMWMRKYSVDKEDK